MLISCALCVCSDTQPDGLAAPPASKKQKLDPAIASIQATLAAMDAKQTNHQQQVISVLNSIFESVKAVATLCTKPTFFGYCFRFNDRFLLFDCVAQAVVAKTTEPDVAMQDLQNTINTSLQSQRETEQKIDAIHTILQNRLKSTKPPKTASVSTATATAAVKPAITTVGFQPVRVHSIPSASVHVFNSLHLDAH
jgi:hypothetical protein